MLSTIPQVADLLRYKGYQQSEPIHYNKMEISIDNGQHGQDWEKFRQHAIANAYDSIKNIRQGKKDSLRSPYDNMPKKNYNSAAVPFGVTVSKNIVNDNGLKGGASLNSISDKEYDDFRQKLIDRRLKEFEERDAQAPLTTISLQPPSDFQQLLDKNDLIILSIEQRFISGVVDFYVYRDLLTLISFYHRYIWVYDTEKPLLDLLNRLEDILSKARETFSEVNPTKKSTMYANFFVDALERFTFFIRDYIKIIGNPPNIRQSYARALSRKYSASDPDIKTVIKQDKASPAAAQEEKSAYQQAVSTASSAVNALSNLFLGEDEEDEGFIPTEEDQVVEEYGNETEELPKITKSSIKDMNTELLLKAAEYLGVNVYEPNGIPFKRKKLIATLSAAIPDERSNQGSFYRNR